jgi:hypothetical protein
LRLDWTGRFAGGTSLTLTGEALNIFDAANYNYDPWSSGFKPPAGETNASFGKPSTAFNPRRFQIGARFAF